MPRSLVGVLCFLALLSGSARGQSPSITQFGSPPVRFWSFMCKPGYIQRAETLWTLCQRDGPAGRMLDSIDSGVDQDGAEFHGLLTVPLFWEAKVIVRPEAEVRGLLVLLRSRNQS